MGKPIDASVPENGTCRSNQKWIGRMKVETPRGLVDAVEVSGFMTLMTDRDGVPTSVMAMLYAPPEVRNGGIAMFNQMDAAAAREMGESLIRLADQLAKSRLN